MPLTTMCILNNMEVSWAPFYEAQVYKFLVKLQVYTDHICEKSFIQISVWTFTSVPSLHL